MNPNYKEALELRSHGKSYLEIKKALGIPKSTLSGWFKDLEFSSKVQGILQEKGRVAKEQFVKFNRQRTEIIKDENQKIVKQAMENIRQLSRYELILIGVALYWAEGYKIEKQKRTPQICFVNSDPYMIALFLRFLREIIGAQEEKLKPTIHLYIDTDKKAIVNFWSKITRIPKKNFHFVNQISRASKGKRSFNALPFGTLKLVFSGRQNSFRVKGWIDALKNQAGLDDF